ncbi:MAG: hypothetical protein SOW94_10725 [Erysipelotrichaceae bacterium]|nr:hypothetical protein [Erysipelotrichaceae bacterium]
MDYCRLSSWVREKAPGSPHPVAAALNREKDMEELADASLLLRDLDWHPCLIGCGELASSVLYALYHCGLPLKRQELAETCTWIGINRAEADRLFYELWIGHEESGTYGILSDRLSESIARAIFTLYGPNRFHSSDSRSVRDGIRRMGTVLSEKDSAFAQYQAECSFVLAFCRNLSEEMEAPVSFQEAAMLLASLKDHAFTEEPLYPENACAVLSCMVQEMYRSLPGFEGASSRKENGLSETERILTALHRDYSL